MATIDPRIAMGFAPTTQIEPPVNALARVLQAQGLQQQNQLGQMKMDEYRSGVERKNKLAALLQGQYGTDEERELALLRGGFIDEAQQLQKGRNDAMKARADVGKTTADTEKIQIQTAMDKVGAIAQILQGVNSPETYAQALQAGANIGLDVSKLPQQYDPAQVQQSMARALTVQQQLEQQWKQKGYDLDVRKQGETERNNQVQNRISQGNLAVAQGNLAVSRDRLNFDKSTPKGVLDPERGLLVDPRTGEARPVTMGGKPVGMKQSSEVKKELLSINQQRAAIDGAIDAVRKTPSAFSLGRGIAGSTQIGESLAGRTESKDETVARGYVFNNVSRIINERAGAAQSAQELARLNSFLPAPTDNAEQIVNKLDGFKQYLADMERGTVGSTASPTAAPAAAGGFKIISVE